MTSKDIPEPGAILLQGGTGTIGRAVAAELLCRGYRVVCLLRPRAGDAPAEQAAQLLPGAEICFGEAGDPAALADGIFRHRHFDAVVSCMASRSAEPRDARAVDYEAHLNILNLARIGHYYATESMLLLDPETGRYDAAATPETGRDTVERGEHAIFRDG